MSTSENLPIPLRPDMVPMRDIEQISEGDRLFYEIGYKYNPNVGYGQNWNTTGRFKEIENVKDFLEGDKLLCNFDYLEHHNFMIIKKNTHV